jgi:hypothetical protein
MNVLAASILGPLPETDSEHARQAEDPERRRRRFVKAALLAQPVRDTPVFRPYASSGFSRAVRAREAALRDNAA